MLPHSGKVFEPEQPGDSNRRRAGRFMADRVQTSVGEILDISSTGMRVYSKFMAPTPRKLVEVTIKGPDGHFKVVGQVVWVRSVGLLAREFGFEFYGLDPNAREAVGDLARAAANNTHIDFRNAG
jgi:hypothetical protein